MRTWGRVPDPRFSVNHYGIDSETRPYLKEHYIMSCKRCGYSGAGTCPVCWPTTVTKPPQANVTPDRGVTEPANVTRGFGTGSGRPREHKTNAERQRAYRERKT